MNGLDLFRSPKTAADEIADIVSAQCPPVVPENCDAFSCRECWLAWLTTQPHHGNPRRRVGDCKEINYLMRRKEKRNPL